MAINRFFKALLFCAIAPFIFTACSNLMVDDGQTQSGATLTEDGKVLLKFGINDESSKTAFPTFNTDGLTSIIIYYYQGESTESQEVGYWTSYSGMRNASFSFNTGSCYFEIFASIQDNCFYEKKLYNITAQTSSISFSPVLLNLDDLQSLGHGSGSVKIDLNYNTENVQLVTGGLYSMSGATIPGFNDETLTQQSGGKVTYEKSGVPSGTYLVTFKFYADADKSRLLGSYREYAYIVSGLTSSSTCTLDALGKLFTITLNFNDGELKAGQIAPANYTRKTEDITLPDAVKSGYAFAGWYESEDFSGDAVTVIPYGSAGNKTFYAKWVESVTPTVTITFDPNGGTITTSAQEVSENVLTQLKSASTLGLVAPDNTMTFKGWAEVSSASEINENTEIKYTDGQSVKISSATTLYALWSPKANDVDKTKDTDKDGLTDYDELVKYFTDPTSADTDGDGWKDGEEIRMYSSNNLSFSPLIADTPVLEVSFDGKPVIYYKFTTAEGTSKSETLTTNEGTTGSSSTTRTNTLTHNLLNEWSVSGTLGYSSTTKAGVSAETSTTVNASVSMGYKGSYSSGDTYTYSQSASQGWSKSWSNGKCDAETSNKTMTGGLILIRAKFKNNGNTAYNVKSVNVSIKRIPNDTSDAEIPMASTAVKELGVIAPGAESVYVIQQDLSMAQTEELLKWSSGLSIEVAGYTISTFQNGVLQPNDFTEALTRVKAQTAKVSIDFGAENGIPTKIYNVAVKNKYNKSSTSINDTYEEPTLREVFEKILNYKLGTDYAVSDLGYLTKLRTVSNAASAKDGVWFINHIYTRSGLKQKSVYFPFTSSSSDDKKWSLDTIKLCPGDEIHIAYTVDKDDDGLPLNEELIYGTSDNNKDTDGDGLSDAEEVYGWYKSGIGLASTYSPSTRVKTSPIKTDTDGDDLLDYSTDSAKQDNDPLVPFASNDTSLGSAKYATSLNGKFTEFTFDSDKKATLNGLYEYIYLDVSPKISFAKIKYRQEDGAYSELSKQKVIKLSVGQNKIVILCEAPGGKTQEYTLTINSKLRSMEKFSASSEKISDGVANFTWTPYSDDRMKASTSGYVLYGVGDRTASVLGDDVLDRNNAANAKSPGESLKGKGSFYIKVEESNLSRGLYTLNQLDTGRNYGFYLFAYLRDVNNEYKSFLLGKQFIKTGNPETGTLYIRARYIRDLEDHDGGHQESEYYWTFEDTSGMQFGSLSLDRSNWFNADWEATPYFDFIGKQSHKEEITAESQMKTLSAGFSRLKDHSFTVHWHGKEADNYVARDDYLGTVTAVFKYSSASDTWTCTWSCAGDDSKRLGGTYTISSKEKQLKNKWQIINESSGEIEFVWDWGWDANLNATE